MSDKELEEYLKTIEPNFDSHIEKGTIEMNNEYYNLLEERMIRLLNENKQLKEKLEDKIELYEGDTISYQLGYDSVKAFYEKILTELEKHCKIMLRIFEKMSEEQRQEQLDKYVIYDRFLRKIQELKEKYKC